MALSNLVFIAVGYIIAIVIAVFSGSVKDVLMCKLFAWASGWVLRLLRLLGVPGLSSAAATVGSRQLWYVTFLVRRPEVMQLYSAVKRLISFDAPSLDGPPGNEIWEVLVSVLLVGLYLAGSYACACYRETWAMAVTAAIASLTFTYYLALAALGLGSIWYTDPEASGKALSWSWNKVIRPALHYTRLGIAYTALGVRWVLSKTRATGRSCFTALGRAYHHFVPDSALRKGHADHKYRPLEGDRHIRLLRLLRNTIFDGPICELIHVRIEDVPDFETISYTWGNLEGSQGILVDGQWMQVTKHVSAILQERVPRFGSRLIWIDAICINQDDAEEKGKQVALMGELYACASRVVVWLGQGEKAQDAFDFLLHLQSNISVYEANDDSLRQVLGSTSVDIRWNGLFHLLDHPYWHRAWIIQEIVKSKNVHILYSGTWMGFEYFANIIRAFSDIEKGPLLHIVDAGRLGRLLPIHGMAAITVIAALRDLSDKKCELSLAEMLGLCRNSHATDLRDKVYATYGLVQKNIPEQLPDYQKPIQEVYTDIAKFLFEQEDGTYALHLAGIGFDSNISLPSWVADWSLTLKTKQGYLRPPSFENQPTYNACGQNTAAKIRVAPPSPQAPPTLLISSLVIDTVSKTSTHPLPVPDLSWNLTDLENIIANFVTPMHTWFREAESLVALDIADPYPYTGQSRHEAYWRTLLADHVGDGNHPISDFGGFYERTVRFLDVMLKWSQLSEADQEQRGPAMAKQVAELAPHNARFMRAVGRCTAPRQLAITARRCMAIGPPNTLKGDKVVIFEGAKTPFLVRPVEGDEGRFQLVGECYVHGMMHGEAVKGEFAPLELI